VNHATIERILNDVLDGVATPEDIARLERLLDQDPTARARYQDLETVFRALKQAGVEEPPAGLRSDILRAVRGGPAPTRARGLGFARIRDLLWTRPVPAFAFTFVAGAAAGLLAFTLVAGTTRSRDAGLPVTGTMLPAAPAGGFERVGHLRLAAGDAEVAVETTRRGARIEAAIDARSPVPFGIELEYDPGALRLAGLDWSGPQPGRTELDPGHLQLEPQGNVHYRLHFESASAEGRPIQITIRSRAGPVKGVVQTGSHENEP